MIGTTNAKIITGGSVPTYGKYFVKVVDYDGKVLDEKWLDNGSEYTLPSAPSHTGLIFQEWSCAQTITNGKITVNNNNVMIGPVYTTVSGKSEFDIKLTVPTGLSVTLNMNGTKDWGDGTTDTSTTHTYTDYGKYTIKCDGTTLTSSSSSGLFGQNSSNINYYLENIRLTNITDITTYSFSRCYSLASVTISNNLVTIGSHSFEYCYSLLSIIIPYNITTISSYTFQYCYSLKYIIVPSSLTNNINSYVFSRCYSLSYITIPSNLGYFSTNAFEYCYSLVDVMIPNNFTNIGSSCFRYCYTLTKMKIPTSITRVSENAFAYCYSIIEYDFSSFTTVPTLSNTNAFTNMSKICQIKVPTALLSTWKTASNWVTYADNIIGV